ncbi:MAG: glycosyltransferase family 4 protein [Candidatus Brocadiaceae bacterium]|nr:glycosyltransferase family 4 protein [Candidatus Brocadiaceae bacterium]
MTALLNFVAADQGGALTYARNVCTELARVDCPGRFLVLLCSDAWNRFEAWPATPQVEYCVLAWTKRSALHRLYFDRHGLKRLARREGAGSLYSQVFAVPRFPGRQVLNLRNAIHFDETYRRRFAEYSTRTARLRAAVRRRMARRSIRQADVVIAPTQAMLDTARAQCPPRDGQLWQAVYHGFDRVAFLNGRPLNERQRAMLDACPPGVPRLLFVSAFCEHKNVDTLLRAFDVLRSGGNDGRLLLTFPKEKLDTPGGHRARDALAECRFQDDIVFLGGVPWPELWNLYAAADVFVFPSYLESFGMPLVEAMASGLPVIASDTAVHREVCGDAAVYFDTFEPEALADRMESVLADSALRAELAERGRRRSTDFSWERHVHEILRLLDTPCASAWPGVACGGQVRDGDHCA